MGGVGPLVALAFFSLLTIAALTSSIAMLEVPVSLVSEETRLSRHQTTWVIGLAICLAACIIVANSEVLFGFAVDLTTRYSQPLLGVMYCVFLGWIWQRNQVLQELQRGRPDIEQSLFWKIWPFYVKFFCPVLILAAFVQRLMN